MVQVDKDVKEELLQEPKRELRHRPVERRMVLQGLSPRTPPYDAPLKQLVKEEF